MTLKIMRNTGELLLRKHNRFYSNAAQNSFDVVVVGGGIVGCATARELLVRNKNLKVGLVEKENRPAYHQSGHNSGVVHAGIYYKPGTLRAELCIKGLYMTYDYCARNNIPYKKCGKLIVATDKRQVNDLIALYERGLENGTPDIRLVDEHDIKTIEPYCRGYKAIHSPHTGIVDWTTVTRHYAADFEKSGGQLVYNFGVKSFKKGKNDRALEIVGKENKSVLADYVVTCGGLQSDKLSTMTGCKAEPYIVPVRGEYLLLNKQKSYLIKGNIYPVPDPSLPFLGVHFTPRMDGSVFLGPNAVLALKQEGYGWKDISVKNTLRILKIDGVQKLIKKHWRFGINEVFKSFHPTKQLNELQSYIPNIKKEDITKGPTGVRAQPLWSNGTMAEDLVLDIASDDPDKVVEYRVMHCRSAPSPSATSSLPIGNIIVDELFKKYPKLKPNQNVN
ncbi:L-2-hydroxyglutarate dehydrogenase, mitochondrial [Adelges cooleyi]|uniref:L-2-hydroxyglutarate dehydrogenase, mitochondrial n=1 Tax=Adelges cooleyi TaxID=133065 RepID=UPI00217FD954|nr:L-2-hydroxyglutarate dehydrogenase, mitochondrial [Adelges cooleyi]XP_050441339.1 L-2-hydroxyglutarate dehydrogenase, mitochondrial [Adelges cooleyi]XP_050441340.1 L-2-hydroxyglutarate dehydrogenase, mitochondrial [Adelges cooleyi]XP_050441341.1 L-2-hydroxyglutarate dehydrogenase, mitochondrial [Adelges cooleyi]XP_050441342.1 L-2-hydroxyglutarate dehydrogenase, mitochondrial [Adelges cooleyi]